MAFKKVPAVIDFPELERKILKYWYSSGVVHKYLAKNRKAKKRFRFLDGPITANNPMGVHHAWGRTYKDLFQRYKNMQGFQQRFQNGFDAQGLWIEVEVEKELGLRSKKDIENLVPGNEKKSIAKFVELCKERVRRFAGVQTEQSRRLGYFMDWDNSYYTFTDENNYMIWHFLKKCHERGLIYKGTDSVPWCPRCGTAISQHEMLTEDYKQITHKSIWFELPLVGKDREFLLVWTTTPWTIPANIAVAVDKKLDYSLVKGRTGDKFWVARDAVKRIFGKDEQGIVKTVKGERLVGLKYKGPFDHLPAVKRVAKENPNFHTVVATDNQILPVAIDEGTGLIHTAVSAGAEDFKLGKKLDLPMIPIIAENADYLEGLGFLTGKNAKKHPEIILDYLIEEDKKESVDWVFDIENYSHRYPVCWRCKTELVWRVVDEWYVAMDPLREEMKRVAKRIRWIPEFGLKRELDWLNNMQDWLISKKRYWGLALPIWECRKCGNFEVIGGKEELKERVVGGWGKFEGHTPHRPWIDEVEIKCSECGERSKRIPDVGNPWLDAGIVAYSTISKDNKGTPLYLTDKKEWEKWFPADFIAESFPGQFKNWFYSLIAMSTVLEGRGPFKTVLGFATLLGEDGRPMHKSWGNAIEFNEGAEKMGADIMRWLYVTHDPAKNLNFGWGPSEVIRRRFFLIFWNVYRFFANYALVDEWKPKERRTADSKQRTVLDRWMLSRLNFLINLVTESLNRFDVATASNAIESFIVDDLSQWYLRRSRERVGPTVRDTRDKEVFYQTMHTVLETVCRLSAPFIPFLTEEIYRNLMGSTGSLRAGEPSVHLASWPGVKKALINHPLEKEMARLREIVTLGHSFRKAKSINLRQPLSKVTVSGFGGFGTQKEGLTRLLAEELNVKEVKFVKNGEFGVKFETRLTDELRAERAARELIRSIQNLRKDKDLRLTDKISVAYPETPENKLAVVKFSEVIQQETLAIRLEPGRILKIWRKQNRKRKAKKKKA